MEKSKKPEKWIPIDSRTKKEQKEHHNKMRGLPVPPNKTHSSKKDYNRANGQKIIDNEIKIWKDEEEYDES